MRKADGYRGPSGSETDCCKKKWEVAHDECLHCCCCRSFDSGEGVKRGAAEVEADSCLLMLTISSPNFMSYPIIRVVDSVSRSASHTHTCVVDGSRHISLSQNVVIWISNSISPPFRSVRCNLRQIVYLHRSWQVHQPIIIISISQSENQLINASASESIIQATQKLHFI